jgi:transcription elongation GreA/GreB family factor
VIAPKYATCCKATALGTRPEIAFIYGKALFDRDPEGDVERAIKILGGISLSPFRAELRAAVVTQLIQCFAKRREWSEAAAYVDQVSDLLNPPVVKIIRGYLAYYQDARQEAEGYAAEARTLVGLNASPETKEFLARLLMLLGRLADALPFWQDLFNLDAPGFDYGNLLDCAARLHRDDVVLKACEDLHGRGIADWHLVEFEIQYLLKYNVEGANARLQGFIQKNSDHKLAKLRLSLLGLPINRVELVRGQIADLPGVDELPLEYAVSAVQVMKFDGCPDSAVEYAYRYLRAHFHDLEAHQALVMSLMPGPVTPSIPPTTLDVVGPDSAVCYREIPMADLKWVVLEDTDDPNGDFEEIPVSSPLAAELIGKKVGDNVMLAKGTIQDRTATIVQILPRYVRRYPDSMSEMQVRFDAASGVESELQRKGSRQKV